MSINITFTMKSSRTWFVGKSWDWDLAKSLVEDIAAEMNYQFDIIENYVIFQFCPEGFLWMKWEDGHITGNCQTNIAGPGFHGAVIHFLELFAVRGKLKLLLDDPTGYDKNRDFSKLRSKYFYSWFHQLMDEVLTQSADGKEQLVCWPINYYLPEEHQDTVVTHIRRFTIDELKRMINSGISMAFAKDFFVWNEEEKDAFYYRNCALVLLHQECFFRPSKRSLEDQQINQQIIDLLEKALSIDKKIPFPKEIYLEICQLAIHRPVDLSQVWVMHLDLPLGCRKELLYRTIGSIRFTVPGHYLHDCTTSRNSERYYDGEETNWHEYYICAINTKTKAQFQQRVFEKENVLQVIEFKVGGADGKIAVYQPRIQHGKTVITVSAQVIYKNQLTMISVSSDDLNETDWAVQLIKKIQTIE